MVAVRRRRTQASNPRSEPPQYMADDSDSDLDTVCEECSSGKQPAKLLLCDKCDKGFHLFCLRPILVSVPKGSWFCPSCSKHQIPKCKLFSQNPHFKSSSFDSAMSLLSCRWYYYGFLDLCL